MAMKFIIILFVVVLAAPQLADAQLSGLLGLININGTIFCSLNGNIVPNAATPTIPFANALVQVSCGGNVLSSAITNSAGIFSIILDPLQSLLGGLLSSCNVVVATPLATCNASLPAVGVLQSPLQLVGTTLRGLLRIVNLVPVLFQLVG
uniref:phylloplanin-like n=1 Tax=Erigeron canadensis TaxID=72917 RepID=UPI001CB98CFE|nr:phylloplanin-like [Erigeron canadensis]